ncbi:IPT/TIG domain-containing protein [Curtobacterium sp. 9128]|uniref:phage tail tube protein n=1 Tax=Curtobacterium sp. 9128 TaxID=1793722 RepID=UPI0007D735C9|nr:IPT/TIG domain-containing protein [Curtobacterium sp. 9128]SBN64457.1 IPT/TIG domain-containing protein [Curtobacterium sp. 9128]
MTTPSKTALARRYACEVTTDLTLAGGWVRVRGVNGFTPNTTPNIEDASDYDTDGWTSNEVTMQSWASDIDLFIRESGGAIDPGQQIILDTIGEFGDEARLGFRYFDRNGLPDAHQGVAIPTWKLSNTAVKNLGQGTASLTGDGPLYKIDNPFTVTAAPVATAAAPATQGTGEAVAISGANFSGATGVKFGATNATSFEVINDQLIVAVLPSGSAGSAAITVTTPNGSNAALAYTRAA